MKIYTKTGDQGETGLLGGKRVKKNHAVVAACGDVDETNSQIGFALSLSEFAMVDQTLKKCQHQLFVIGGQLANCLSEKPPKVMIVGSDVSELEAAIDEIGSTLPKMDAFILPGGCQCAAVMNVARCVCRRAERSIVALVNSENTRQDLTSAAIYMNRLSDLLFVVARRINFELGIEETKWLPGEK